MNTNIQASASAVVFAYHDIGVRCIEALLELGIDIKLVITHLDSESELIWFDSVKELALKNGINVITPDDPNSQIIIEQVTGCQPDFIFSFYYRQMLGQELLVIPSIGAFNVHGSLLPKYRGRVPVNWAIIHGETECGISLHEMVVKPDAGDLLAQSAVSILRNDTAFDVFQKLKCAAESMLIEAVPDIINGQLKAVPMDLASGSYFGGRGPEDGRIDWHLPARDIHNLVRAVSPPFPGAFFEIGSHRVGVIFSYFRGEPARFDEACLYVEDGCFQADCTDGRRFMITHLSIDGKKADPSLFEETFGSSLSLDPVNSK